MKKTIDIVLKTLGVLSLFQLLYGLVYLLFPDRIVNANMKVLNKMFKMDDED
jgi:hypothetical protein